MKTISIETQKLAALAVFGTLYDAKKDIYNVLCDFIKQLFVIKGLHSTFSIEGLRDELSSQFGFDNIPLSVVKTTINKMKELHIDEETHQISVIDEDIKKFESISKDLQKAEQESDSIIEGLFHFIEKQNKKRVSEEEKEQIQHELYSYLLKEEYQSQYADIINLYILEHEKDENFITRLQQIVVGVLIQSALRFQSHPNQIDKFNNTLYIYLDTEIIFHLAGYNGALHQTLAQEFLEQVSKMNSEAKKIHKDDRIKLRFFEEVDQEIADFFNLAIKIVNDEIPLDKTKKAMKNIVNGCQSASEIIAKKSELNLLLKQNNIQLDNKINYYEQDKHKYNIENKAFYENLTDPLEERKVDAALCLLSHVNVRRGERSQKIFNNVGCILLTGDATTMNIALDEKVLSKGNVPLATTMSYLTNRFWFTTNQSFSNNPNIQSFKIVTRARIALSTEMSHKIQQQFRKLQQEHKQGRLSDALIAEQLSELQKYSLPPENLDDKQSSVSEYYNFLRISDAGQLVEERAIEKKKSDELIKTQSNTIAKQTQTINEQNSLIKEQNHLIEQQKNQITDHANLLKQNEQTITQQDERIRVLEEKPLKIALYILFFLRFLAMWLIFIASLTLFAYTIIDIYKNYEYEAFYNIIGVLSSIICLVIAVVIPIFKKTRFWLSYKSFNTESVEHVLQKRRK